MSLLEAFLVPGSMALLAAILVLGSWLEARLAPPGTQPQLIPVPADAKAAPRSVGA